MVMTTSTDGLVTCIVLGVLLFVIVVFATLAESGLLFDLTCRILFREFC